MDEDLREGFSDLDLHQKKTFLRLVHGHLEATASKLAKEFDALPREQKLPAAAGVIGLEQLIQAYRVALRDLDRNPQADLASMWAEVDKYFRADDQSSAP